MKALAWMMLLSMPPHAVEVIEVSRPAVCNVDGKPVLCAYFIALLKLAIDKRDGQERGI